MNKFFKTNKFNKIFTSINQNFFSVFLIIVLIYEFYLLVFYKSFLYTFKNEWAFSEYFIDYSGGFIRRGLIGEVLYNFSKTLPVYNAQERSIKILNDVISDHIFMNTEVIIESLNYPFVVFLVSFFSFFHILYFLIKKINENSNKNKLLIIFSPFGLFYFLNNLEDFFGRKDLFILNLLIFLISRKKMHDYKLIVSFLISGIFLSLSYEMFILFLPIFWLLINGKSFNNKILKLISFSILAVINLLLLFKYFVFEEFESFKILCDSIHIKRISLQLDELQCWGGPRYLDFRYVNSNSQKSYFFDEFKDGIVTRNFSFWIIVIILLLITFKYFVFQNRKFYFGIAPLFLLFVFAQDYGRWVVLIFLITIILSDAFVTPSTKYEKYIYLAIVFFGVLIDIPVFLNETESIFRFGNLLKS